MRRSLLKAQIRAWIREYWSVSSARYVTDSRWLLFLMTLLCWSRLACEQMGNEGHRRLWKGSTNHRVGAFNNVFLSLQKHTHSMQTYLQLDKGDGVLVLFTLSVPILYSLFTFPCERPRVTFTFHGALYLISFLGFPSKVRLPSQSSGSDTDGEFLTLLPCYTLWN